MESCMPMRLMSGRVIASPPQAAMPPAIKRALPVRLTAAAANDNPDSTKSGLDWILQECVELGEGGSHAIAADEHGCLHHLFGTELEA
jgi:hypothetical protein